MHKSISMLLISSVLLAGCGQSRLNPLNWFGRAERIEAPDATAEINPLIPKQSLFSSKTDVYEGQLVPVVREMKLERLPGGAILRVTGLAATQGSWDVRLEETNNGEPLEGVLTYELRALPSSTAVGTERSRLMTVAVFVSDQQLERSRSVQVVGAENSLISRRR